MRQEQPKKAGDASPRNEVGKNRKELRYNKENRVTQEQVERSRDQRLISAQQAVRQATSTSTLVASGNRNVAGNPQTVVSNVPAADSKLSTGTSGEAQEFVKADPANLVSEMESSKSREKDLEHSSSKPNAQRATSKQELLEEFRTKLFAPTDFSAARHGKQLEPMADPERQLNAASSRAAIAILQFGAVFNEACRFYSAAIREGRPHSLTFSRLERMRWLEAKMGTDASSAQP